MSSQLVLHIICWISHAYCHADSDILCSNQITQFAVLISFSWDNQQIIDIFNNWQQAKKCLIYSDKWYMNASYFLGKRMADWFSVLCGTFCFWSKFHCKFEYGLSHPATLLQYFTLRIEELIDGFYIFMNSGHMQVVIDHQLFHEAGHNSFVSRFISTWIRDAICDAKVYVHTLPKSLGFNLRICFKLGHLWVNNIAQIGESNLTLGWKKLQALSSFCACWSWE